MTAVQVQNSKTNTKKLEGKIAVVTGGSRGIGAAIALRLANDGATVALSYNANKDAAEKVVEKIAQLGGKAIAVKANASSALENQAFIAEVKKLGNIDILVNNAAIFEGGPIDTVKIDQYDRVFDTNLRGVVATTLAVLPHLNDGGRIINISSGAARASLPGFSIYSATKAAMEALTRGWAQDLGKRKITVNAVAPGATVTDMLDAGLDKATQEAFAAKTALQRLGQPEDIADVVAFLASDDSRWVTGKTIDTDGGLQF
jgi:3-oxoacyl-[acyl-carrier protein] reductase